MTQTAGTGVGLVPAPGGTQRRACALLAGCAARGVGAACGGRGAPDARARFSEALRGGRRGTGVQHERCCREGGGGWRRRRQGGRACARAGLVRGSVPRCRCLVWVRARGAHGSEEGGGEGEGRGGETERGVTLTTQGDTRGVPRGREHPGATHVASLSCGSAVTRHAVAWHTRCASCRIPVCPSSVTSSLLSSPLTPLLSPSAAYQSDNGSMHVRSQATSRRNATGAHAARAFAIASSLSVSRPSPQGVSGEREGERERERANREGERGGAVVTATGMENTTVTVVETKKRASHAVCRVGRVPARPAKDLPVRDHHRPNSPPRLVTSVFLSLSSPSLFSSLVLPTSRWMW